MSIFRKLLILTVCAFPLSALAADYPWLTFRMADGSEMSVAASGLAINYNDGVLTLKSATVDQSLPTAQIKSMRFTSTSAGIYEINASLTTEAEYYDLAGMKAGVFRTAEDARRSLPPGIYIMKSNNRTTKVIF